MEIYEEELKHLKMLVGEGFSSKEYSDANTGSCYGGCANRCTSSCYTTCSNRCRGAGSGGGW